MTPLEKPVLGHIECFSHTVQKRSSRGLALDFPKGNVSEGVGFQGGIVHNSFQGGVESLFLKGILFHSHRPGQEFDSKELLCYRNV